MESSLASSNPALFSRIQALTEPAPSPAPEAAPGTPLSLEALLESSPLTKPSTPTVEPQPQPAATALALPYSHAAMVELMVENPGWTTKKLAAHFGKGSAWFAAVLASDGFQLELDKRRGEVLNPAFTATMEERFRALALRSLDVLQDKLDSKDVSDNIVLRAAEIGVKALGMGQVAPPPVTPSGSVESLADRLVAAFERQRNNVRKPETMEAEVVVVEAGSSDV